MSRNCLAVAAADPLSGDARDALDRIHGRSQVGHTLVSACWLGIAGKRYTDEDGGRIRTKTLGSDATIPLPAICTTALKLQVEQQASWQTKAHEAWQDSGLVITTRHGTPFEPRNFLRSFTARSRKAGVRYIKPHGMRRTCASLLAALDVHPRVAMRILRHSKIAVTMEIYTEVPDEMTRDALRRLGEQLDGLSSPGTWATSEFGYLGDLSPGC